MTNVRCEALVMELEGHVMVVDDRVIYKDSGLITEVRYTDADKSGQYDTFMHTTIVNIGCGVDQMQLDRYIEANPIDKYDLVKIDGPVDALVRCIAVAVSNNNEVHVNEEDNTMLNTDVKTSKGDKVVDVVAKLTGKTIVIAGKTVVATGKGSVKVAKVSHKWVKNTGAPTAIKAGRGIGSKFKRFITTTYNEVQTSRQEIKNNNNNDTYQNK